MRAMVENVLEDGGLRHVSSAYLTYVAMDMKGNRMVVPQAIAETEHQRRRYEDAGRRREMRAAESSRTRELRSALGTSWNI